MSVHQAEADYTRAKAGGDVTLQLLAPAECYHTQSCLFNTLWWGVQDSKYSALLYKGCLSLLYSSWLSSLIFFQFLLILRHVSLSVLLSSSLSSYNISLFLLFSLISFSFPFFSPLLVCIKVSQRSTAPAQSLHSHPSKPLLVYKLRKMKSHFCIFDMLIENSVVTGEWYGCDSSSISDWADAIPKNNTAFSLPVYRRWYNFLLPYTQYW